MASPEPWMLVPIAVLSFVIAFFGASIGMVGGHFRLPLLVMYLGSVPGGTATNLAVSAAGALSGSLQHAREGRVSWRMLMTIGIPSGISAWLGAHFSSRLDAGLTSIVIGLVLLGSGLQLAIFKESKAPLPGAHFRVGFEVLTGIVLGGLSGIVGLMMGSLRLPAMIRVLGMKPEVAVGTNLAIGCLTGLFGTIGAIQGGFLDIRALLVLVPVTALGSLLGASHTKRYRKETLKKLIGWTVSLLGVWMLAQAFLFQ
ncbi:MAG TPA: sulfite exporter TauE/SafE family protein [Myxococcota bacterium]|nr:sulfite exporter TauE/SafE family protein [Myxococcota bacterium]HQK51294.1 sulfite exporter TauE/SafE family protein [Myxococcota bacterium]